VEIEKLHSFIEVYNCHSISKAASNLFLSQPALSRRIKSLEEELKIELFHRNGTDFEPTEGAQTLYREANKIIRQHDLSIIKMNQFKKGLGGALRIGAVPYLKLSPTVHAVSLMQARYPDVELSFDCDTHTNVPYFLANRKIDVGITTYGEVRGLSGFACETLSKNTLSVLIGKNHPLWSKRPLYVEDLDGDILYYIEGASNQSATAISQYYKEHKIRFAAQIPCRSMEELMLYLAKGNGVANTGVIASEYFSSMPDLVDVAPIERTSLDHGHIVAVYDEENALAKKFISILKETW